MPAKNNRVLHLRPVEASEEEVKAARQRLENFGGIWRLLSALAFIAFGCFQLFVRKSESFFIGFMIGSGWLWMYIDYLYWRKWLISLTTYTSVGPEAVRIESRVSNGRRLNDQKIKWKTVERVAEYEGEVILHMRDGSLHTIPRDAFADDSQREKLRELMPEDLRNPASSLA